MEKQFKKVILDKTKMSKNSKKIQNTDNKKRNKEQLKK